MIASIVFSIGLASVGLVMFGAGIVGEFLGAKAKGPIVATIGFALSSLGFYGVYATYADAAARVALY